MTRRAKAVVVIEEKEQLANKAGKRTSSIDRIAVRLPAGRGPVFPDGNASR